MTRADAGGIALPRVIVDARWLRGSSWSSSRGGSRTSGRGRRTRGPRGSFSRCEGRGLRLEAVSPLHVAAYIRTHPGSVPTVKQHLAAIRMLCERLVVSQVLPVNPAAAVRGPKHVVTKGATSALSPAEVRKLLESIDTGTLARLRGPGRSSR